MALERGDLIFVHGHGFVGDMIDWAEHGVYSHVAIYVGNNTVLEAQGGRIIGYQSLAVYKGQYDIGHIKASPRIREKVIVAAMSKMGTRYGWKTILLLALKLVFHINWKYNIDIGLVCSDYGAYCWQSAGMPLTKKKYMNTPQDLADSIIVTIEKGVA